MRGGLTVDLALEEAVGRDRRAVADGGEVVAPGLHHVEDLRDPGDEAVGGVRRRARGLGRDDLAGVLVDGDDVGEGPAGVDADPDASSCRHGSIQPGGSRRRVVRSCRPAPVPPATPANVSMTTGTPTGEVHAQVACRALPGRSGRGAPVGVRSRFPFTLRWLLVRWGVGRLS
jgi:hypothetical protein